MRKFETLIDGLSFTECPRWHDGRLYFSDFYTQRVLAVALDGTVETIAEAPGQPSGLGFLPDGRMLIVSMRDRKIMRRELDSSLVEYADLSSLAPWHLNDMLVDHEGRAWVGNFGFDLMGDAKITTTNLISVDRDGCARVAAEGLGFPNGMALTADDSTLIVAETFMNRLSAFDVASGELGERRTWAAFGDPPKSDEVAECPARQTLRRMGSVSMRKGPFGWPMQKQADWSGWPKAGRSLKNSKPMTWAYSRACSEETTGEHCSSVSHPHSTSLRRRRSTVPRFG